MPQLFKKEGVEIFSVGNWNGDDYTLEDLNHMVTAFDENKNGSPPHLKLGHDPKQALLQKDGLPAAGWIDKLYVTGEKLRADFIYIPKKVYELIENKAYRKVSSEIMWNAKVNGKVYKRMLAAVALLGANTPGVSNLSDILAMYQQGDDCDLKVYNALELSDSEPTQKGGFMPKTENEIKLEYDLQKSESDLKLATEKADAAIAAQAKADKEIADLKQFKADAEAREIVLQKDAEALKVKNFVTELKADMLCTPAMEPMITELLGETKKEYTVKVGDKEEKLSKEQLLKEALKLFKAAAVVNFVESSTTGDKSSKEDAMDAKAKKFMADNKCSYSTALKSVMKDAKN